MFPDSPKSEIFIETDAEARLNRDSRFALIRNID